MTLIIITWLILLIFTFWFSIQDVLTRRVSNKSFIIALCCSIVPIVMLYVIKYIPEYGVVMPLVMGISAIVLPFALFMVMRNSIGAMDCKWMSVIMLAFPLWSINYLIILIFTTIILWVGTIIAEKVKRKNYKPMPAMLALLWALIILGCFFSF